MGVAELERFSTRRPKGTVDFDAVSQPANVGVVARVWLDADTEPAELLFQKERVAGGNSIERAEIEEIATASAAEHLGYPDPAASDDGAELYTFSQAGRHLTTTSTLGGQVKLTFAYDAAGRLTRVTDWDANVTTVERDPTTGRAAAIVGPHGQRTALG